jgi:hypothetical protein
VICVEYNASFGLEPITVPYDDGFDRLSQPDCFILIDGEAEFGQRSVRRAECWIECHCNVNLTRPSAYLGHHASPGLT